MKESIEKALNEANWEEIISRLVCFADKHMRYVLVDFKHMPVINGYNPEAITQEAIKRTIEGSRQWNPDTISLLKFLFGVIRSIIDCEMKKHCAVKFTRPTADENGKVFDPVENIPDDAPTPEDMTDAGLIRERQRAFLDSFILTIEEDEELSLLILAMMNDYIKNKEISEQIGIHTSRISELKRKLQRKMEAFAGSNRVPLEKNITLVER